MCKDEYCKKCVMKSSNAGIVLDENGTCNICNGDENKIFYENYQKCIKYYKKFKADIKSGNLGKSYDCLVMFSGGKDSINILQKMVNEEKLRVLALTVDLPFECSTSKHHIEYVTKKLNVPHMVFKPAVDEYSEMMKNIFLQSYKGKKMNLDKVNKFKHLSPCIVCTCYMKIISCLIAEKFEIPYVLYCADPAQMANLPISIESSVDALKSIFDMEFLNKIFNDDIDKLDSSKNSKAPVVVYPYVAMSYNPDKIIKKLKDMGLYNTTPQEGHCLLWSLLNYNSIKRYDSPFYILDYASNVRSLKADRNEIIQCIELFKELMMKMKNGDLNKQDDEKLKELLNKLFATEGERNYVYKNIHDIHNIANELNIKLSDIE